MIGGLIEGIGWTGIIVLMLLSFVVIHYVLAQKPWRHLRARSSDEATPNADAVPVQARNDMAVSSTIAVDGKEHFSPEYIELLDFFLNHLEPLAEAQLSLQEELLSIGVQNETIRLLARQSLPNSSFYRSVSFVSGRLGSSPPDSVSFDELTVSIHNAEFNSQNSINETIALVRSCDVDVKSDARLVKLWEEWRMKHDKLKAAYESIKRDLRFGRLFRPLRESRWGTIHPPPSKCTPPNPAAPSRTPSP